MTDLQKDRCNEIIHGAALKATAAGGFSGLFGAVGALAGDATVLSAIEIAMIVKLGKVFNREISDSIATGILGAVAGTVVGKGAASVLTSLLPGIGAIANGAASAGTVEAIGWAVANGFDNGDF